MLRAYGTWPIPGGWLRQAAKFVEAVELCDQAVGLYRRRAREKDKEAQALADEAARVFGRKR